MGGQAQSCSQTCKCRQGWAASCGEGREGTSAWQGRRESAGMGLQPSMPVSHLQGGDERESEEEDREGEGQEDQGGHQHRLPGLEVEERACGLASHRENQRCEEELWLGPGQHGGCHAAPAVARRCPGAQPHGWRGEGNGGGGIEGSRGQAVGGGRGGHVLEGRWACEGQASAAAWP